MTYTPVPPPVIRQHPPALPPTVRNLELPRPAPPTHHLELPRPAQPTRPGELPRPLPPTEPIELPPRPPAPVDRPAGDRSEPGTWREIIARFEQDLGDVPDEAAEMTPPDDGTAASETAAEGEAAPIVETPGSWEVAAMTTPDYVAPQSIHDREHDSWPVETDDGDAVPAWNEGAHDDAPDADDVDADLIGELLLDEVVPADPWDRESEPDEPAEPDSSFPLDAFIVPAGVQNVTGLRPDDTAHRVALRLDELARQLRDGGLGALGSTDSPDELSRVLAAIVSGYMARDA